MHQLNIVSIHTAIDEMRTWTLKNIDSVQVAESIAKGYYSKYYSIEPTTQDGRDAMFLEFTTLTAKRGLLKC